MLALFNMNRELAEELKDAGFKTKLEIKTEEFLKKPQHEQIAEYMLATRVQMEASGSITTIQEPILSLTLEEAIEACGDVAFTLYCFVGNWHASYSDIEDQNGGYQTTHSAKGLTPLEAVCRLWLALNKK